MKLQIHIAIFLLKYLLMFIMTIYCMSGRAQHDYFRGKVVGEVYWIPRDVIDTASNLLPYSKHLDNYKTGEKISYFVCNDTVYIETKLQNGVTMRSLQMKNSTTFYSESQSGFVRYPRLPSLYDRIEADDWKNYNKRNRNPLEFNFKLVQPSHQEDILYANVDRSLRFDLQYEARGEFRDFLHPLGLYNIIMLDSDSLYIGETYKYYVDEELNCKQLFDDIEVLNEVEDIPKQTVFYEPDTAIDFSPQAYKIDLGEIIDTLGVVWPSINLDDDKYTYIEIFTDNCPACDKQIPYLNTLYKRDLPGGLDILSLYVGDKSDTEFWKDKEAESLREWSTYKVLMGRDSHLSKGYSLDLLPRYIIVDSLGRIVTRYAPRPSDNRIEIVLKQLY